MKAFSRTVLFVLGGGACAALAAAIMSVAVTADESTSVAMGAFCLLFPGSSGACAVPPSGTGYGNNQHMIQPGFLGATNLNGGAAAAAASYGSPDSPLDGYLYSDLLRGLKKSGTPTFVGAWQCSPAQHFPSPSMTSRCGSALRARGGGSGSSFSSSLGPASHNSCFHVQLYTRLITTVSKTG